MVLEEFWAFVSCSGWCRISILVKSWPFVICDSLEWLWAFVYGSGWSRLLVSERFWALVSEDGFRGVLGISLLVLLGFRVCFWGHLCWSVLLILLGF